jgi:tight adherence protein B
LQQMADAGGGSAINADDPKALTGVFASEAQTLAKQILITVVPPKKVNSEGTLSVSIQAGGDTYTDSAFVTVRGSAQSSSGPAAETQLVPVDRSGMHISKPVMLGGLIAAGTGILALIAGLLGAFSKKVDTIDQQISAYTRKGRGGKRAAAPAPPQGMAAHAVGMAEKALEGNHGFEVRLGARLEAAGMSMKPAEWLLLHAAIAVVAAAVGFLMTSGGLLITLLALAAGVILPWVYLGMKRRKRLKSFNSQLAETLQLMAGSLQAGLSLTQGIDTIVREGAEPISSEFRRAIVEARLGVQIEDALDSVGERMESADFRWTVMAIRIQREVGGNLSELLLNVAGTLREREFLRRQVKALSAEGRFSAYILLALPPAIILYMTVANPTYLHPLISTPIGFAMLGGMATLMLLGTVSMMKLIKLEV